MTPDPSLRPVDPVDRAHLTGASRPSPPIHRYLPSAGLADLVQRYWIPVWSLEEPSSQSTLQHPVCLLVVSTTYARFYGVVRGLSTVTLEGTGWAVGVMFTPAAGALLLGGSVEPLADGYRDLTDLAPGDPLRRLVADDLVGRVRAAMRPDPSAPTSHAAAIALVEERLRDVEVDPDGLLVNRVVQWVVDHPGTTRVSEVAGAFDLSERRLQRLVRARVGMSPKWLIQRRRLHDAVLRLKEGEVSLAEIAVELGYSDQAHFTTDFRTVTGMTPGEYLADQR
ncbi:MAG: helix-turn-helix domain-containing protein [Nocardioides sp.]|uniref:helix-turn-helix domain-containing protein n=1 Tax=Nocardioides sp. TaxID=35761 RepID=UPI003F037A67